MRGPDVPRTVASIALDIQTSKGMKLSGGQFDRLCAILYASGDPEGRGRGLAAMDNRALLELIGDRKV